MVAWPPTTVAWPFSDFFQNFPKLLETSKKRCLTVGRRSRDLRPLSRDRSATFFKKFSNCLKRRKNVVWQSADSRVTSVHCHVTVQRLFSKKFLMAWNVEKTLFDSRPTVAWPQPLSRDRSATFFKNSSNCLIPRKTVVWQSVDGRVTSDLVGRSKKCCLKVSGLSRDGLATLFPCFSSYGFTNCLAYVYLVLLLSFRQKSLATYLLLQEWSDSWKFRHHIKARERTKRIFDFGGKFQLVDSPWGEQVPHYKHRRRSITYLLREIPVKNRERWDRSQQTGKMSG